MTSADCIRRRCDGSLFHARGSAVAKERSPKEFFFYKKAIYSCNLMKELANDSRRCRRRRRRRPRLCCSVADKL